jgi:hypothetical protein
MFSSAYRDDLDGIYAVSVSECSSQQLPYIDDGGEGEHSAYHVSIDFTNFLVQLRLPEQTSGACFFVSSFQTDLFKLTHYPKV